MGTPQWPAGLNYIGDVRRLPVRPGDRFVVTTPERLTRSAADGLALEVANTLGVDLDHVLVLDGGATIAVRPPFSAEAADKLFEMEAGNHRV